MVNLEIVKIKVVLGLLCVGLVMADAEPPPEVPVSEVADEPGDEPAEAPVDKLADDLAEAPRAIPVFPGAGILPKEEIGAMRFLGENPEADGRGIVVAVFDTGVDPGAAGLAVTPTGEPKIIGMVDATGSGDVVTETVVQANSDGTIDGLSGRTLVPGPDWSNPTGDFYLGLKAAYDLYPADLVGRMKDERKREWEAGQRAAENDLRDAIRAWKDAHEKPTPDENRELADLEARLEALEKIGESYEDPGPVFDCVVFGDGDVWRAVVDSDEDGDLTDEALLTNFAFELGHGTFQDGSLMNYAVNVYDEGKLLSIVVDSGMHGTHVAGIVGAYFPDQPELNGVAPGAQIVSVKIGDTRLGGMETGSALSRAAIAVRQFGCHLVNMSFGEPTRLPNGGQLIEKLADLVREDDVVFVASAGNSGPALSTVGAPGATTSGLIGVGATVTPGLMRSVYAMREILPTNQFTWSSRGPAKDGDLGVSITAPGGAISPVPRWNLERNHLANGTSMASPNACGGIALVLSALKAEGKSWRADWVRRAVEATAEPVPGVEAFAQGQGMLQVDRAHAALAALDSAALAHPRFEVSVAGGRGIYLREPAETERVHELTASVAPAWRRDEDNETKADFEMRVRLECEADWVAAPEFAFLANSARRFDVNVDPTELEPGDHFAEIVGFDAGAGSEAALFRIPVTVVKAGEHPGTEGKWERKVTLGPGAHERFFFEVPPGATWAELAIDGSSNDRPRRLVIHAQHVVPAEAYRNVGERYYVTSDPAAPPERRAFAVYPGRTLELCAAQFWSVLGTGEFDLTLTFHGLATERGGGGVFSQGDRAHHLRIAATARAEQLAPSASFDVARRPLAARSAEIRPLPDERDRLEDAELYHALVLEYGFGLDEPAEVRPVVEALNDRLYESEFEGQLTMVFDANKRRVAVDDTYPEFFKLGKGQHVLRLQLRHKDRAKLEKLKALGVVLERKLAKPVEAKVYASYDAALLDGKVFAPARLDPGARADLFVGEPDAPDGLVAGDTLAGYLALLKDGPASALARVPLTYLYHGRTFQEKDEEEDAKTGDEEKPLTEEMFDAEVALLEKYLEESKLERFDELKTFLLESAPDNLQLRGLALKRHLKDGADGRMLPVPEEVLAAADGVITAIDQEALARYFGRRHEPETPDDKRQAKVRERERALLAEALAAKARVAAQMGVVEPMRKSMDALEGWVDVAEGDTFLETRLAVARATGDLGNQLALLTEKLEGSDAKKIDYEARIALFRELGWHHLAESEERWQLRRFQDTYEPF
ncbi:hypothetical protein BH23VER1_BH23VER1_03290 [soil metagenome]